MIMWRRAIVFLVVGSILNSAWAKSDLSIAHLYEQYAGGGGCFDVFLVNWDEADEREVTDLKIGIEVFSKTVEPNPMSATLEIKRIGGVPADHQVEASVELPSCPDGKPKIVVKSAAGTIQGKRVDFVKEGMMRVKKIRQYSIRIGDPTHRSTRPLRAGQL